MSFSPTGIYSIYKDRRGHLWFGSENVGLCRYDGQTLSWMYEEHLTTTPGWGAFGIRSMTEDNAGALWMAFGSDGIWKYDGEGVTRYSIDDGAYAISILSDQEGKLWAATVEHGLYTFDGASFKRLKPSASNE